MSFFKILIFLVLMLIPTISFSDSHDQKKEVLEQVKEIAKEIEDDEEGLEIDRKFYQKPNMATDPLQAANFLRNFTQGMM